MAVLHTPPAHTCGNNATIALQLSGGLKISPVFLLLGELYREMMFSAFKKK
jgi:hypothetical protein